jgi:Response regulator containing a CheY-like receiver domain and an HD-GYP domain
MGIKCVKRLRQTPRPENIPVIFLTAKTQEADEARGFELGAVDYITKPISPPILLARVQTQLALQEARSRLSRQNEALEEQVMERTRRLDNLQNAILVALASLAETRDDDTGQHVKRTQQYVKELGTIMAEHPKFNLSPAYIDIIYKTSYPARYRQGGRAGQHSSQARPADQRRV